METATKSPYETDFAEWTVQVAKLLRQGRLAAPAAAHDLSNVAEEIEDLGKINASRCGRSWCGS
jgi:Domain of unknown function DUF29